MADILDGAEKLMGMDDRAWARHANPWSAYTRMVGAVPTFLAIWSIHWIGWLAAAPIAAVALWTWVNPRLFPAPSSIDSWASKGVLGERVFLNRKAVPIPTGFRRAGWLTTAAAALFMALFIYGFAVQNLAAGLGGWFGAVLAKIWFVDRMAWLWTVMCDADPLYERWAQANWGAVELGR